MKNLILTLTLILFGLTSCNMTDYHRELTNTIAAWNSYAPMMEGMYTRVSEIKEKDEFKNLKFNTDNAYKNLDDKIKEIEAKDFSDDDVRKINEALLDYLKAERDAVTIIIKLYEKGGEMTDDELNSLFDELDAQATIVDTKADNLLKAQSEYAKKHNITITEV